MIKKYILLALALFAGCHLFGEVKQGNLSDGTPYYYNVPDPKPDSDQGGGGGGEPPGQDDDKGSDDGDDSDAGGGGGSDPVDEAKKRAEEAEKAAMDALAEFNEKKKEYLEAELEVRTIDKYTREGREFVMEDYEKAKAEYLQAEAELRDKCDAMIAAYNELGAAYDKYGYSGDPVRVGTGEYVCEYIDFEAQDYLNKFQVKRNLSNSLYYESFGRGWSCSLDSRIIRCNFLQWDDFEEKVKSCIEILNSMITNFDSYNSKYPDYPVEEFAACVAEAQGYMNLMNRYSTLESERNKKQEYLAERNKYVTYGYFSTVERYYGYEDYIKYMDEDGNIHTFKKSSNGLWQAVSKLTADRMYVKDRSDGGYILYLVDGSRKEFSYYGILEKEVDSNGNQTLYWNDRGYINKIQTKTGEIITVNRNRYQRITSIQGPVSGTSYYSYENGDQLIEVTDNQGIHTEFSYAENGRLSEIKKGQDDSVFINYENYGIFFGNYVSSIQVAPEKTEYFQWQPVQKKMEHTTTDGLIERYTSNKLGLPIHIEDAYGNITNLTANEKGLITASEINDVVERFSYDSKGRVVSVINDEGGKYSLTYNSFNQPTSVTDPDGFKKTFEYDSKGNLTATYFMNRKLESYWYYGSGLLKKSEVNNVSSEYEYNKYGSITRRTVKLENGKSYTESWKYDSKNRIIAHTDALGIETQYSYSDKSITEIYDKRKKTIIEFDSYNREIQRSSTDLKTGKNYKKQTVYDNRGNVHQIFYDGILYEENSYLDDGRIASNVIWNLREKSDKTASQGIRTDYKYNSRGYLISEKKSVVEGDKNNEDRFFALKDSSSIVQTMNYDFGKTQIQMTLTDYFGKKTKFVFNKNGDLIKEICPDGRTEICTYSKSGRIKTKQDRNHNICTYNYKTDGSCIVEVKDSKGNLSYEEYNNQGLLVKQKNFLGIEYKYDYNTFGLLTAETGPYYFVEYEYDVLNRLINTKITEQSGKIYEKSVVYDDRNYIVSFKQNDSCYALYILDCWNRPSEITNKYGKFFYEYDVLNNVKSSKNLNGEITRYEYDASGNCARIVYSEGYVQECERDCLGIVTKLKKNESLIYSSDLVKGNGGRQYIDCFGNRTKILVDNNGNIMSWQDSRLGSENYSWNSGENQMVMNNGQNDFIFNFNENGNLVWEKNYSGNEVYYSYDSLGRLISKQVKNGQRLDIEYNDYENSQSAGGDYIQRNYLGLITRMKNSDCDISYDYDSLGNLISCVDHKLQSQIFYSYDDFGRMVKKTSDSSDCSYEYDEFGKVESINDSKNDLRIHFDYDKAGREIERKYSNGLSMKNFYDNTGALEAVVYRDFHNEILEAQFLLRNSEGRISLICDKDGLWKKIEYSERGMPERIIYPYSQELEEFYREEALKLGFSDKNYGGGKGRYSLELKEGEKLRELIGRCGCTYYVPLKKNMYGWEENIEYGSTGEIVSVENGFGKIFYEYDEMHRITSKFGTNSKENGVSYEWSNEGNLKEINARDYSVKLHYGINNRPEKLVYNNKNNLETKVVTFAYDPLGRRIAAKDNNGSIYSYVYDGFSLDIIHYTSRLNNETAASYYGNYEQKINTKEIYKWIDDSDYTAHNSEKTHNPTKNTYLEQTYSGDARNSFTALYINSLPVVKFYGGIRENEFMFKDYHGNIIGRYGETSGTVRKAEYDLWGNLITGEIEPSYSYTCSFTNLPVAFYNIGFRDYCPDMKSFITEDPSRDGNNWYSYCPGDVINYNDVDGYKMLSVFGKFLMTDYNNNVKLGNSSNESFSSKGCYVTTYANIAAELQNHGVNNSDYDDPMKINSKKELFVPGKGEIYKLAAMDAISGGNTTDYWTKKNSTEYMIQAQLAKADALRDECVIAAVFDLTSINPDIETHMVVLNKKFNENGYLDSLEDITPSSKNDKQRLDKGYLDAYNLKNVVEIQIINSGTKSCNK